MATQWTAGLSDGQTLYASTLNQLGAVYETWTPALTASTTNPTLGTGSSQSGRYGRVNKLVYGTGQISFGTSGVAAGNGFYYVSIPIQAQTLGQVVGTFQIYDSSAASSYFGFLVTDTTTRVLLYYNNPASVATNAAPWTWAASDFIRVTFTYEAT